MMSDTQRLIAQYLLRNNATTSYDIAVDMAGEILGITESEIAEARRKADAFTHLESLCGPNVVVDVDEGSVSIYSVIQDESLPKRNLYECLASMSDGHGGDY